MKKLTFFIGALLAVLVVFVSCQREINERRNTINTDINEAGKPALTASPCNSNAYVITLESRMQVGGNWEWVWSIYNPNPGNGTNGTSQDMSHWGMQFGSCFSWNDVIAAAYSFDNITWTSFIPAYQVDPSQSCVTTPVFKYNAGTSGAAKTYYRLVLSRNYDPTSSAFGYYKAGARMPCCTFTFTGVGCLHLEEGCSFSQGYWFANGNHVWPDVNGIAFGNVTIGTFNYSEAEGRAIWNTSNAGGIKDSKKAFLQVAAIKLSGSNVSPTASVWADVAICEAWLATLGKLTPANLPTGNQAVREAAGRIGDWINNHHCGENPLPTKNSK